MKSYPIILICIASLLSIICFSSCQQNLTGAQQTKHPHNIKNPPAKGSKSDQYFPNSVGDRWTYAVSDSSGRTVDTLKVTVQAITKLADDTPANLWQYVNNDSSYTRYVVQWADSVLFYTDSAAEEVTEKIITPYKILAWWDSPTNGYNISKIDTLKLTNGIKRRSYKIEVGAPITAAVPINIIERELCVSPFIGIVKYTKYSSKHLLAIESQYQLLNYNLK